MFFRVNREKLSKSQSKTIILRKRFRYLSHVALKKRYSLGPVGDSTEKESLNQLDKSTRSVGQSFFPEKIS